VGKKPLYYAQNQEGLTFASELKALLIGTSPRDIDPVALHHYLTFQYVPTPWATFQGVRKLKPGHMLICQDGRLMERAYWTLSYRKTGPARREAEYREEFLALLKESTRLRLMSDVPLGAFLSGGMDSSAVVALMGELSTQPVKTFSIGFKEDTYNELPYARQVASQYGTDHHEFVVEPSAVDILPTLARVFDEPFADSSAIPTYYVSQLSRQFVTVVLNGDGGDELLAGYSRYHSLPVDRLLADFCNMSTQKQMLNLVRRLSVRGSLLTRLKDRLERFCQPFSHTYLGRICYFGPEEKSELYTDGFREQVEHEDSLDLLTGWFESLKEANLLDQVLRVDTKTYLPDDLLVKVDRATMAHGLEARSPLLDHRLVEFCAALPLEYKMRAGESKYLLKAVMSDKLPMCILQRPKMGFGVPIDEWFRGKCRSMVEDILLSPRSLQRGYFQPSKIRRLVTEQQQGRASYGSRVYALLMLELWHREYVDGASWARVDREEAHVVA
jgi:asparagine synthase (glutamine-hydrolysing)